MVITAREEFDKAKGSDLIHLQCDYCNKEYHRMKRIIRTALVNRKSKNNFCSMKCIGLFNNTKIIKYCSNCNKPVYRKKKEISAKTGNVFCNHSCSASFNNKHKKHGTRRSKLEKWLEIELPKIYPNLEFHFNRKDTINSELDIYIPFLKLAFELNGIFHYEPIYGEEKLSQIKNNDNRKFQACLENGIELCIIDTSKQKYFKLGSSKEFLNIIINIINKKLSKY